jgi:hydrogenase/urease accessory protein HupE
MLRFAAIIGLFGLIFSVGALADEIRPAYLQIEQTPNHGYSILWKQPVMGDMMLHLVPHLSSGWLDKKPKFLTSMPGFLMKTWIISPSEGRLDGQTVRVEGLDRTITDVIVNIKLASGTTIDHLNAQHPSLILKLDGATPLAVPAFLTLGVEHILTGYDHLSFVFGLLLLVGFGWSLLKTITAFTIAHSITLAATVLGFISLNPPLIEALVALSIVFVFVELVHAYQGKRDLTIRRPWVIAFGFGLMHGAAFASALTNIGMPTGSVPLCLLLFNIGVEIGQLTFIAAVLPLVWLCRRLPPKLASVCRWVPPYAIGSCAAAWFIERTIFALS